LFSRDLIAEAVVCVFLAKTRTCGSNFDVFRKSLFSAVQPRLDFIDITNQPAFPRVLNGYNSGQNGVQETGAFALRQKED
jgi:hypothetical protein